MHAVAVDVHLLLINRNENLQGAFRNVDDGFFAGALGGFRIMRDSLMRGPNTRAPISDPVTRRCRSGCCGHSDGKCNAERKNITACTALAARYTVRCLVAPRDCCGQCSPTANVKRLSPAAAILVKRISFCQIASVSRRWRI